MTPREFSALRQGGEFIPATPHLGNLTRAELAASVLLGVETILVAVNQNIRDVIWRPEYIDAQGKSFNIAENADSPRLTPYLRGNGIPAPFTGIAKHPGTLHLRSACKAVGNSTIRTTVQYEQEHADLQHEFLSALIAAGYSPLDRETDKAGLVSRRIEENTGSCIRRYQAGVEQKVRAILDDEPL